MASSLNGANFFGVHTILGRRKSQCKTNHRTNAEDLPKHCQNSARVICFSGFFPDLDGGELQIGNRTLTLRPTAFILLAHLAQRPGCLITKDASVAWSEMPVSDPVGDLFPNQGTIKDGKSKVHASADSGNTRVI